ncbi:MAG: sugar phosphate isomerase/epimerase [bacterium]|nr:sugar phosphate isomerase/epimerase [bacterium]
MAQIRGIGNAPCSWGVLEFEGVGSAPAYERVLEEMHQSGYAGTELGDFGFMPTEPDDLTRELETRQLTLLGAFVPVALGNPEALHPGRQMALKTARLLAAVAGESPVIVLSDENGTHPTRTQNAGRIRPEMAFTQDQLEAAAYAANQIALSVYQETGLQTVFHPHCAGFIERPEEVSTFMDATHPRMLGLCLDTAHCAYGGGNPVEVIRRYGDRIRHVHFKGYHEGVAAECRERGLDYFQAIKQGIFCELEKSSLDFGAIVKALEDIDYDGWIVVEQDVLPGMGNPLDSAQNNRAFLRTLGL